MSRTESERPRESKGDCRMKGERERERERERGVQNEGGERE
jgi:hypothetical protein